MEYVTALQNLLNQSQKTPDKILFNQPVERQWRQYSWQQVENQARTIAAALKEQGLQPGDKVSILSKNCVQWCLADLAIMMAGLVSVPIYPTADEKTISHVLKHSGAKAVFVGKLDDPVFAEQGIPGDILRIAFPYPTASAQIQFDDWLEKYQPLSDICMPTLDDIATIVYTSGSTGLPKGVVLTHKNCVSAAQYSALALDLKPEDRVMSYLPLAHIAERCLEFAVYYKAIEVFFTESLEHFVDDLKHAKPTKFYSVPRLWSLFQSRILEKMPQAKLSFLLKIPLVGKLVARKIRTALGLQHATHFASGSAPIAPSVLRWYGAIGIPLSEGWGMTETSGLSCCNFPFEEALLGTIGRPLDCVEMKLSEQNEILIRGDAVFSEYYKAPDKTAESFTDGWFHTGDYGQLSNDGVYKITGRIKEQFKTSKGKYVAPVPIESLISVNLDIAQVCVVGTGMKQPGALIVLVDSAERKSNQITKNLEKTLEVVNQKLQSHEKLDFLLVCTESWTIENTLLTPTMKIKRNIIEQYYAELLDREITQNILWQEDLNPN